MAVRQRGDAQSDQDNGDVAGQHGERADEPELFGHGGEDEVRVSLGQELQLALTAQAVPLAHYAARAEGNLGLDDVVARP